MVVAADIMGPFPRSKSDHQYVFVVQDLFTKWIECSAIQAANGQKICEMLSDVISRLGALRFLLTDNGTEFINRTLKAFADEHGITHTTIPPYHPQANSVERVNQVLKTMIIAFLERDHREWDQHLKDFRFAYNTAHHSAIGASPALLNLGRELSPANSLRARNTETAEVETRDPAEWSERMQNLQSLQAWVSENLEQAYQKQSLQYNLRRRDRTFRVGDLVLRRQHVLSFAAQNVAAKKLTPKFHGPFRIKKRLSPVVCELASLAGIPGWKSSC
ncbi:uncharacterized protein K02A2.6-like [Camponotus floridanus]|uniref:uncharacterized protein K02A2.6-like n=1 Tax=Camponotus floridanus TaxID=104421 RepID=UPI000DC6B6C7|nr:uncharacterized protein K02A2.6-like [Camponotus floridanus]